MKIMAVVAVALTALASASVVVADAHDGRYTADATASFVPLEVDEVCPQHVLRAFPGREAVDIVVEDACADTGRQLSPDRELWEYDAYMTARAGTDITIGHIDHGRTTCYGAVGIPDLDFVHGSGPVLPGEFALHGCVQTAGASAAFPEHSGIVEDEWIVLYDGFVPEYVSAVSTDVGHQLQADKLLHYSPLFPVIFTLGCRLDITETTGQSGQDVHIGGRILPN